ncbi:hypothetical protein REPUB_Repub08aG0017000 [Reevesia pubescens]
MIFGGSPSAICCECVRVTHVECVCPFITLKQIESCGRIIPHNFTYGSKSFHHLFFSCSSYQINFENYYLIIKV